MNTSSCPRLLGNLFSTKRDPSERETSKILSRNSSMSSSPGTGTFFFKTSVDELFPAASLLFGSIAKNLA